MKNILLISSFIILIATSCAVKKSAIATAPVKAYEVSYDNAKVYKGLLHRADIENDTAFHWFKDNIKLGITSPAAIETFKTNASKFQVVVFFGTWCEDSQNLVPQFYRLVDKSGYPDSSITLIGVDRAKTTLDNLHKSFGITNVPTFIVMHNGKEAGRVIEYGESGEIDKELAKIVAAIQ